jgi:hypothetical protein
MYTIFGNGEGQGYTILLVRIRCLCVGKKSGTSLFVTCSLGYFLSIWPSRTLFTVFTSILVILSCTQGWGKDVCPSPMQE